MRVFPSVAFYNSDSEITCAMMGPSYELGLRRHQNFKEEKMKTKLVLALAAMLLAGCSTTYMGGTGTGSDTGYGAETSAPPTDFGRGGNRANPPPYDTQSG